jgi:hypothetical protein
VYSETYVILDVVTYQQCEAVRQLYMYRVTFMSFIILCW